MSYKIAISSSDGKNIDLSFGATEIFYIYEAEGEKYHLLEERKIEDINTGAATTQSAEAHSCQSNKSGCGGQRGCGLSNGCGGGAESPKVEILSDCRCIVCKKIGFSIIKQLEKKAITAFDVDCTVQEALIKITKYLERVDNHRSLFEKR